MTSAARQGLWRAELSNRCSMVNSDYLDYLKIKTSFYNRTLNALCKDIEKQIDELFHNYWQLDAGGVPTGDNAEIFSTKDKIQKGTCECWKLLESKSDSLDLLSMKDIKTYLELVKGAVMKRTKKIVERQYRAVITSAENNDGVHRVFDDFTTNNYQIPQRYLQPGLDQSQLIVSSSIQPANIGSQLHTRRKISPSATKILKEWMINNMEDQFPSSEEKRLLALKTKLTLKQVSNWFVNHRGKRNSSASNSNRFKRELKSKFIETKINNTIGKQ